MRTIKSILTLLLLMLAISSHAQILHIPDAIFKSVLIELGIDTSGDGEISHAEAQAVINLDVRDKGISDLTGIEAFTNLESLICSNNNLTSLDISGNKALTSLYCNNNQLSELNTSNQPALAILGCWSNHISSLDMSNNPALTTLYCNENQLSSLNLTNNPVLAILYCYINLLTILDLSNNVALTEVYCNDNLLTSLIVSTNNALTRLDCYNNQLASLDVSACLALTALICYNNLLTILDVTNNLYLIALYCSHNQLTSLDVSMNTALQELFCYANFLTTLILLNNPGLIALGCSHNLLTHLNLSHNIALLFLDISLMPTLGGICVWTLPFPSGGVEVNSEGSDSIFYTTNCSLIIPPITCITKDEKLAGDGLRVQQNLKTFPNGDELSGFMQRGDVIALSALVSDKDFILHQCICNEDTTSELWGPYSDLVYYEWSLEGEGKLLIPDDQSGTVLYELPICIEKKFEATVRLRVRNGEKSMAEDETITGSFTIKVSPALNLLTDPNNPPPPGWGSTLIISIAKNELSSGGDGVLNTKDDAACYPQDIVFDPATDIQVNGDIRVTEAPFCKPDFAVLVSVDAEDIDSYSLKCVGEEECASEDSISKTFYDPLRYDWSIISGIGDFPLGNKGKSVVFHKSKSSGADLKCIITNIDGKSNDGTSKEVYIHINAAEKPKAFVGLGDDEASVTVDKLIAEWYYEKEVYVGPARGFKSSAVAMKSSLEAAGYEVEFWEHVSDRDINFAIQNPLFQAFVLVGHGSHGYINMAGRDQGLGTIRYSGSKLIAANQIAYNCEESPRIRDLQLIGCEGLMGNWGDGLYQGARLHGWKTTKIVALLEYYARITYTPLPPRNLALD